MKEIAQSDLVYIDIPTHPDHGKPGRVVAVIESPTGTVYVVGFDGGDTAAFRGCQLIKQFQGKASA